MMAAVAGPRVKQSSREEVVNLRDHEDKGEAVRLTGDGTLSIFMQSSIAIDNARSAILQVRFDVSSNVRNVV